MKPPPPQKKNSNKNNHFKDIIWLRHAVIVWKVLYYATVVHNEHIVASYSFTLHCYISFISLILAQ